MSDAYRGALSSRGVHRKRFVAPMIEDRYDHLVAARQRASHLEPPGSGRPTSISQSWPSSRHCNWNIRRVLAGQPKATRERSRNRS